MTDLIMLHPNALQPCGTRGALVRHRAHGRICPECEPDEEYPARCPMCLDTVTAVGSTIQPHTVDGRGRGFASFDCQGAGVVEVAA